MQLGKHSVGRAPAGMAVRAFMRAPAPAGIKESEKLTFFENFGMGK
jgi:hypothetical protein